jgi:hypothetical protein
LIGLLRVSENSADSGGDFTSVLNMTQIDDRNDQLRVQVQSDPRQRPVVRSRMQLVKDFV